MVALGPRAVDIFAGTNDVSDDAITIDIRAMVGIIQANKITLAVGSIPRSVVIFSSTCCYSELLPYSLHDRAHEHEIAGASAHFLVYILTDNSLILELVPSRTTLFSGKFICLIE